MSKTPSNPVERFFSFMRERESVRLRRAAGEKWPWTEDKILRKYKFTNVKRYHDRTSRLLINEFYKPNYDAPRDQLLLNCAIARYFGTIEFMRAIGWQTKFRPKHIIEVVRNRMKEGKVVWTGAYVITSGNAVGPKEVSVVENILRPLMDYEDLWRTNWTKWQKFIEALQKVHGFGGSGFMAKEVTLDTRYTSFWPEGTPKDVNTWTPVGPGSMRGAARVIGKSDDTGKTKLSIDATLQTCIMLFRDHKGYWPEKYVELELHDIQFQLCEFDKYERIRLGQGRARPYHPTLTQQGKLL